MFKKCLPVHAYCHGNIRMRLIGYWIRLLLKVKQPMIDVILKTKMRGNITYVIMPSLFWNGCHDIHLSTNHNTYNRDSNLKQKMEFQSYVFIYLYMSAQHLHHIVSCVILVLSSVSQPNVNLFNIAAPQNHRTNIFICIFSIVSYTQFN